jgi:hypothetical protein
VILCRVDSPQDAASLARLIPDGRVVVTAASFRVARKAALVFREWAPVRMDVDYCSAADRRVLFLPAGDGEKFRGLKADVVILVGTGMPPEVLERVGATKRGVATNAGR